VTAENRAIGVNSLGFGGTIAVKSVSDFEYLKQLTPLRMLEIVAAPAITHT